MQISLRSYLTVGTATVVGAGAIALTPALPVGPSQSAYLPVPAVAEVSLTGLSVSLADIIGVLQNFSGGGLLPDLSGLPPDLVKAVVVEFIKEAAPVVKTTAGDIFQYVGSAVTGLVVGPDSIPVRYGSAIAAIPGVVKTALVDLKNRDIPAALKTLNAGLLAPITSIGEVLIQTANGIKTFVGTQIGTLEAALPGILMSAIAKVIGNNTQGLLEAIQNAIAGLFGGAQSVLPAAGPVFGTLAKVAEGAPALVSDTPAVSETESAAEVDAVPAAAAASPAPRAVARAAAAASVEAEPTAKAAQAAEAESPEPQVVADQAEAPVTRPGAVSARSGSTEEAAGESVVTTRPKQTLRAARHNAQRPKAAAASPSE